MLFYTYSVYHRNYRETIFFIFFFNFFHLSLIDLFNLIQLTLLTYLSFRLTQLTYTYNINILYHARFLNLSDGSSDHGQRLTLFSFVCALNSCILFYRSPPVEPSPSPSPPYKSSRSSLPLPPPPFPPPEFSLFSRFSQFITLLSLARRGDHQTADNNIQKEGNTVLHGVKNDSKVWSPCSWWTRWLRQTLRSRRTSPCTEGLKRTRWDYVVGASL